LCGNSRRFHQLGYTGPKALLPVGEKTMIEHVLDMFDGNLCEFHFVVNLSQVNEDSNLINFLKSLVLKSTITVIEPHEIGPVLSVRKVTDLNPDDPIIICYCDFIVEWNFRYFLEKVVSYDGAIPSFKGFHPASFGTTYFAYMKTNAHNDMLELKEKKSFTNERQNEPASAGIYYFRDKKTFDHYADELLKNMPSDVKEAYVSLLYNFMVRDKLNVLVTEVSKFICLGTPSDYEQYNFWDKYFKKTYLPKSRSQEKNLKLALIPMAGKGTRFSSYGYRVSKPLITVQDKPMILHAIDSIPKQDQYLILVRANDGGKYDLAKLFHNIDGSFELIEVKSETSGQAATCLLAENRMCISAEMFITSCDYRVVYNDKKWDSILLDLSIDGAIWVTKTGNIPVKNPEAFAYCITNEDGTVSEIVEKKVISQTPNNDPLVLGTFWFRRAENFLETAHYTIQNDIKVNGEHYVGNSINYLLSKGLKFVTFEVDQWISFGDPFELQIFEYWEDYFTPI